MSPESRAALSAIRDQARLHALNSADAVEIANNRTQAILLSATAIEAANLVAALDSALLND